MVVAVVVVVRDVVNSDFQNSTEYKYSAVLSGGMQI